LEILLDVVSGTGLRQHIEDFRRELLHDCGRSLWTTLGNIDYIPAPLLQGIYPCALPRCIAGERALPT
jgi:hypothetical protein